MQEVSETTGGAGYGIDAIPIEDMKDEGKKHYQLLDGEVHLRGSKSRSSGSMAFPEREVCLETGARDMETFLFGGEGVLYSFSMVHVSSSRPVPYVLGYVDFPNGLRVLSHVVTDDPASLRCDQFVQLRATDDDWFVVPALSRGE